MKPYHPNDGKWLCGSCAGWYYDYCNPLEQYEHAEGSDQCFENGAIVKCPINKFHFIPTKSHHSLQSVQFQFPKNFP